MSYFQDGWHGSHDFKFGYDWKRDRRHFGRAQPFDIHYRDLNGAVNELEIYNSPNTSTNDVVYNAGFISDTWKFNDRLTLQPRPALRALRRQLPRSGDDAERPAAAGQLAGDLNPAERARYLDFIAPQTVAARDVARTFNWSPRVGFAYDLTGDNRTVLKALLRPLLLQLGGHAGRPREPGRQRAAALPVPRRQRQPSARWPAGARPVPLDAGRRRLRQRRRQPPPAVLAGNLDALRARDHDRPLGPRLVRLQERARRVRRNRSDARSPR